MYGGENSTQISLRIKHIYHRFYADRAEDKFVHMCGFINEYLNNYTILNDDFSSFYSQKTIGALVDSYYLDVIRYKEYHFNPKGNTEFDFAKDGGDARWAESVHSKYISHNKVIAFTAKWFMKYKPVTITHPKSKDPTSEEFSHMDGLNSNICIALVRDMVRTAGCSEDQFNDMKLMSDLAYHLRYRSYDERHFFMIFQQLII